MMRPEDIQRKLNENSKECIIVNRRKGPDAILQIVNLMGLIICIGWISLIAICEKAEVYLFNLEQKKDNVGDMELLNIAMALAIVMFFLSAGLLLISLKRTRRRGDKIKISLLASEVISFVIGILLLVKFY